jgi:hypothetical protein
VKLCPYPSPAVVLKTLERLRSNFWRCHARSWSCLAIMARALEHGTSAVTSELHDVLAAWDAPVPPWCAVGGGTGAAPAGA